MEQTRHGGTVQCRRHDQQAKVRSEYPLGFSREGQAQTEAMPQPPGENPIIVELDEQDALTLNGEAVAPEALATRVAERLHADRQKVVFFKIADDANYGRAVRIMDTCRGAGARTLGIVTQSQ